jgi:hypothetical protein
LQGLQTKTATNSQSSSLTAAEAIQAIELIPSLVTPTIHDFWLAGITDAEGCFNCSLLGNSNAYRFRFLLAQKGEVNLTVL